MNVAFVGTSALDQAVAGRLRASFRLEQVGDADALGKVAPDCDVLVLGGSAPHALGEQISQWSREVFGRIVTVIDQRVVDPERTLEFATRLQRVGVALVDAPIHCEKVEEFPALAATLCGGNDDAFGKVRAVLEAMGAKVIHFGSVGSGHTARLLVGAAATCNRMATCEGAATGFANGLSITDMAHVLNRSSGVNSGTERVLPHLGTGGKTTDVPLATVADEMRLTSQLAMRASAPLLVAGVVGALCRSLANRLNDGATFDDAAAVMQAAAGVRYTPD